MIFNSDFNSSSVAVKESPYPVGLEGALMHIYENECNYNALMKAVGISELKYYQETGKDLFVTEAGAFGSFIDKAKTFFKKVIEKIKAMYNKFGAMMGQFAMKDKDFVKKYQNDILRRDLSGFEFNGYQFKGLDDYISKLGTTAGAFKYVVGDLESLKNANAYDGAKYKDADAKESVKESLNGAIAGVTGNVSFQEMKDSIKEKCYGDKDSFAVQIREQFGFIEKTQDAVKQADKAQKDITDYIGKVIAALEKIPAAIRKTEDGTNTSDDTYKANSDMIKNCNDAIDIARSLSNAVTAAYGIAIGALKDRNRQAKAICVKAMSYKHEAAMSESSVNDLFAGVTIK